MVDGWTVMTTLGGRSRQRDDIPCTGAQIAPAPPDFGPRLLGSAGRTGTSRSAPRPTAASCVGPSAARDAAGETVNTPPFGVAPLATLCCSRCSSRLFVRFLLVRCDCASRSPTSRPPTSRPPTSHNYANNRRMPAVLDGKPTNWDDFSAMHVSRSSLSSPATEVLDGSSGRTSVCMWNGSGVACPVARRSVPVLLLLATIPGNLQNENSKNSFETPESNGDLQDAVPGARAGPRGGSAAGRGGHQAGVSAAGAPVASGQERREDDRRVSGDQQRVRGPVRRPRASGIRCEADPAGEDDQAGWGHARGAGGGVWTVASREFMGWSLAGRGSERFDELFRQIAMLEQRAGGGAGGGARYPGFDLSSSASSSGDFSPSEFYQTWEAFGTTLGDMDFCEEDRDYGVELAHSSRQARRWAEGERRRGCVMLIVMLILVLILIPIRTTTITMQGRTRRRQYNEGVRSLVAFVKRRDQRWKRHVAERARLREERARREREDRARREQARREARLRPNCRPTGRIFLLPTTRTRGGRRTSCTARCATGTFGARGPSRTTSGGGSTSTA